MSGPSRSPAGSVPLEYRLIGLQALLLGGIALALALVAGPHQSFLAGGACALLPNAWLAWRMQRIKGAEPRVLAGKMMLGAVERMALMAALLAFALIQLEELIAPAFFAGFIVALATHHVALVLRAGDD